MFYNITDQYIRTIAQNHKAYKKGVEYALNDKVLHISHDPEKEKITSVVAGGWLYDVTLVFQKGRLYSYGCDCPAFKEYPGACKHVVATLKIAQKKFDQYKSEQTQNKQSVADFLALFTRSEQKSREVLNFKIELTLFLQRQIYGHINLKIGLERLYVIKNLKEFLTAMDKGDTLKFGAKFTYDPFLHTFKEEDRTIIEMLKDMLSQYEAVNEDRGYYYGSPFSSKPFVLNKYYLTKFLDALGDKFFHVTFIFPQRQPLDIPYPMPIIREDIPLDFYIKSKDNDLALALETPLPLQLTDDGRYYIYEEKIYQVSPEQSSFLPNLIKTLSARNLQTITFSGEQKDFFASEAIPLIEKLGSVSIEPEIAENFVREELIPKIYFDPYGENGIRARVEFHYGDHIINPFSSQAVQSAHSSQATDSYHPDDSFQGDVSDELSNQTPQLQKENSASESNSSLIIIRQVEKERKILDIFEQGEFAVSNGSINLEDDEKIYEFIVEGLPQLQNLAETYYSEDFKINIRTSTSFSGQVQLDESLDLLEISFQYSDINQEELADVFHSLKIKKKYHRLRDGTFLDLQLPELESMATLLDQLNLTEKDLENQTLQLPKYRAMFIDSFLRQSNLPGIKRNQAFKELVQNILEPQDGDFEPPSSLKNVLRDYQKTGFKWLKTLASYGLGGILADDMGLGKTLQVLAFILSEQPNSQGPALVIAPTSLVYNWQGEGEKFAPELKILVVDGTPQERQEQLATIQEYDLVVTSYAILRRDIEKLAQLDFSYCFLDEAQNIKNPQTINARSVQKIKAKGYFALTGTPIENNLAELWSLFNFCLPGYLLSHKEFLGKFANPIIKDQDPEALAQLSRHTKPFILRRLKKDVLKELPPKIETELKANLTEEQRKIYLAYLQQTKSQIANNLATAGFAKSQIQILAALTRLRQICSHPGMFIENYTGESGKMELFKELLPDILAGGHRVLVFSQFTSMLDIIRDYLQAEGISHFYLSGSTKAQERSLMATAFNQGQGDVFLVSLKAGGTGLNLVGADTVIHFDPWWNPAVEDQATDRAYRIGQKNSVQVIRLLTHGTIEEKVNALQAKKKKLIDAVIQPGETFLTKLTEEELRELFELS